MAWGPAACSRQCCTLLIPKTSCSSFMLHLALGPGAICAINLACNKALTHERPSRRPEVLRALLLLPVLRSNWYAGVTVTQRVCGRHIVRSRMATSALTQLLA